MINSHKALGMSTLFWKAFSLLFLSLPISALCFEAPGDLPGYPHLCPLPPPELGAANLHLLGGDQLQAPLGFSSTLLQPTPGPVYLGAPGLPLLPAEFARIQPFPVYSLLDLTQLPAMGPQLNIKFCPMMHSENPNSMSVLVFSPSLIQLSKTKGCVLGFPVNFYD